MELTLNLLWAVIAVALLALWTAPGCVRSEKRRVGIALLALLCVICVLFPVVSMTDDLSASPADPETVQSQILLPHFLAAGSAWVLVYDPHTWAFRHEVETQPDFAPPAHAFLTFLITRRPPPLTA